MYLKPTKAQYLLSLQFIVVLLALHLTGATIMSNAAIKPVTFLNLTNQNIVKEINLT